MATAAAGAPATGRKSYWGAIALIGLLATAAGVAMPQLLPDDAPPVEKHAKDQASVPGDLHYAPPEMPEVPSTKALFVRLAGMTVLVLVLGVGVLWCGKSWLRGIAPNRLAAGKLTLVETLHLGNRCCLHLVQFSTRQVLVGADASGIRTVVPLPEDFENCLGDTDQVPPRHADAA